MSTKITYEELCKKVRYEDGKLIWLDVKLNNAKIRGKVVGSLDVDSGYYQTQIFRVNYKVHLLIWLYHNKEYASELVDHIDMDKSNNRINNLRLASKSQNAHNRKKNITNKSGYKGVFFHKPSNKWAAAITVYYKKKHLGTFDTPELAFEAYKIAADKYHGEFANY